MLRSQSTSAAQRRHSRSLLAAAGLVGALALGLSTEEVGRAENAPARKIERQTRSYSISIDGTRRGSSTTQFRSTNGTVWLKSESEIKVDYWIYKYIYTSSGTELWRAGRIVAVDNTADYNGTQYLLKGAPTPRGMQITTNGVATLVSPEIWDTSYLILPERLVRVDATKVVLFDSDKGKCQVGKIQFVGDEVLNVAEGRQACTHYRIAGDAHVDVWYDAARRLVLEESQESGHKVRFELLSITAE
jgi:Family of unknown function (DUF6134)